MQGLVEHLVKPIVGHPDDVSIKVVEGDSTVLFELIVNEDDKAIFTDEDDRTLRAIRNVLSAAAGKRKTTLELVDEHSEDSDMSDDGPDDESDESDDDESEESDDESEESDDDSDETDDD